MLVNVLVEYKLTLRSHAFMARTLLEIIVNKAQFFMGKMNNEDINCCHIHVYSTFIEVQLRFKINSSVRQKVRGTLCTALNILQLIT